MAAIGLNLANGEGLTVPRFTLREWIFVAGVAACSVVWYAVGQAVRALL
jgi:hypothetical protein